VQFGLAVMSRTHHTREPWTTLGQRRGALIVALLFVLLAAAITATLMNLDHVPVQNPAPKPVDDTAMLRLEREQLERIEASWQRVEPTAAVSMGW
jgi:hypothetical protein